MQPTSEERIEVAERLRRQLKYMRENDSYREDVDILGCGNTAYRNIAWAVDENSNWEKGLYVHIVDRLADLIDTTCHMTCKGSLTAHHDFTRWECGKCGAYAFAPKKVFAPRYCPHCGARVVNDGE